MESVTYETLLLKVLGCLERFTFQHHSREALAWTRAFYGSSIITNIWSYRVAYGLFYDCWLVQVCLPANIPIVAKLSDNPHLYKTIITTCQMLYGVGEVLPIANKTFLAIQALVFQQGVKPPKGLQATSECAGCKDREYYCAQY